MVTGDAAGNERDELNRIGEQFSTPIPEDRLLAHSPNNENDFLVTHAEATFWYVLGYIIEEPNGNIWSIR